MFSLIRFFFTFKVWKFSICFCSYCAGQLCLIEKRLNLKYSCGLLISFIFFCDRVWISRPFLLHAGRTLSSLSDTKPRSLPDKEKPIGKKKRKKVKGKAVFVSLWSLVKIK